MHLGRQAAVRYGFRLVRVDKLVHERPDALDHAHHELDRARLMLTLAMECSDAREAEHRAMLLDAALSALAPAIVEFARTLRLFHLRRLAARVTLGRNALRRGFAPR